MAGGRERKGGRSGSGGETNPRERKARRRRGRKRIGVWREIVSPKKLDQGFHGDGGLWKPLMKGLLVGRLGVSLSIVGGEHLGGNVCVLVASTFGLVCACSWEF